MADAKKAAVPTNEVADAAPNFAPPIQPATPVDAPMSLDDYAVHRSNTDRRVELFNAFVSYASRKGMGMATEAQFDAEYAAFINAPV